MARIPGIGTNSPSEHLATTYGQVTFLEKVGAIASTMLHLRESVALFTNKFINIYNDINSSRARLDVTHFSVS